MDSIVCSLPAMLQGRDLRVIPMDMFEHCSQLPSSDIRTSPSSCTSTSKGLIISTATCLDQCPRAVNLRQAPTTLVLARLVCGVVWLLMVVVAMYGCIYAMLAAKYKQEQLKRRLLLHQRPQMEPNEPQHNNENEEEEKEMEPDFYKEATAGEDTEWVGLPPEVCV